MNFEEAGRQYVILRERFENRLISREKFVRAVGQLVVTAPDGKKWTLEPFAATWVEVVVATGPESAARPQKGEPQNLLQLIITLASGMVKSLPRMLLTSLLMAVITWVAHTYIIAKINDGLMYREAMVAVNSVVHLRQTHFPGVNLFWGLLSYFLNSFFLRALSVGPWNWLKSIVQLPINIKFSVQRDKALSWTVILAGAFASLLIMLLFRNFMLSWILAIGILLILTARFASLEVLFLKTALLDLQRLLKRRFVPQGDEYNSVYLLFMGMCGGFLLVGIWRARISLTIVGMVLVVAFFVLRYWQQHKARAVVVLFMVGSGLFLYESAVFAFSEWPTYHAPLQHDSPVPYHCPDRGFLYRPYLNDACASLSRVDGNWFDWWDSEGAGFVRMLGLIPAAFSFTGGILGAVAANLTSLLPSLFPSMTAELPPRGDFEVSPQQAELEKGGQSAIQQTPEQVTQKSQAELDAIRQEIANRRRRREILAEQEAYYGPEYSGLFGGIRNAIETIHDAGEAVGTTLGNTVVNIGSDFAEAGKTIRDAVAHVGSETLQFSRDVWNDPSIISDGVRYSLGDIREGVDAARDAIVRAGTAIYNDPTIVFSSLWDAGADMASRAINTAAAIRDAIRDPQKVWDFVRNAVGAENFANALDPNRSLLSRVGQVLIGTGKVGSTIATGGKAAAKIQVIAGKVRGVTKATTITTAGKSGVRTAKPINTGAEYVSTGKPANTAGVTRTSQRIMQNTVDENHLQVITRQTTPRAQALIESGKALPKPVDLKAKTLDKLDELLGGPKNSEGLVGFFKPEFPPAEVMNKLPANKLGNLIDRYVDRAEDYLKHAKYMKEMERIGRFKVVNKKVIDVQTGKPFTGDVDLFDLRNYDGSPLTLSQKKRYIDRLIRQQGSNVMHGDVRSWTPGDKGFDPEAKAAMLRDAMEGGKGVTIYSPNAPPAHAFMR